MFDIIIQFLGYILLLAIAAGLLAALVETVKHSLRSDKPDPVQPKQPDPEYAEPIVPWEAAVEPPVKKPPATKKATPPKVYALGLNLNGMQERIHVKMNVPDSGQHAVNNTLVASASERQVAFDGKSYPILEYYFHTGKGIILSGVHFPYVSITNKTIGRFHLKNSHSSQFGSTEQYTQKVTLSITAKGGNHQLQTFTGEVVYYRHVTLEFSPPVSGANPNLIKIHTRCTLRG